MDIFGKVTIQEHTYLPPGTILVSSDIAAGLRELYGEEGRDAAFLKALGIADRKDKADAS